MVTTKNIFKNLQKQRFMSLIKLSPKLCTTYTELCKSFGKRDEKTGRIKIEMAASIEH